MVHWTRTTEIKQTNHQTAWCIKPHWRKHPKMLPSMFWLQQESKNNDKHFSLKICVSVHCKLMTGKKRKYSKYAKKNVFLKKSPTEMQLLLLLKQQFEPIRIKLVHFDLKLQWFFFFWSNLHPHPSPAPFGTINKLMMSLRPQVPH